MTGLGPLVEATWLAAHLQEVRVVDVRWYLDGRSGRAAFDSGHLPGAVWLDLDRDLSAPPGPADGRHPLPAPEAFAAALGAAGIGSGTPVVAYDDTGGPAARLWWMLHTLGEPVAVLDGGLSAWSGPLSTDAPAFAPVQRPVRPWPAAAYADADAVAAWRGPVLDARTPERFAAGDPAVDPRPGHVPGALNAPWAANLGPDGRFLPASALRARFGGLGAGDGTVAYCGSGVTACHDLLALTLAGFGELALYPGSWSQWGADAGRPAQTGR